MQTAESIGFIQYWGFSPQMNLVPPQTKGEVNILLSANSDIRHILETCLVNYDRNDLKLNFYIQEKQKEPFCRSLLLLLIMHTANLTYREKTEIFLEIFGNTFIRESTQELIDKIIPYIDDLVSKESKHKSALNHLVDLKELKFKDRDDLVDILRAWYSTAEFQIEKLRDHRLRYHYGARYDFRANIVDWDYQMNLKDQAPQIHFIHYKEWRKSGIAFESRFSTYPTPNRTLSSYLPGKNKITKDSVLVRGYWGDILISPYLSFGIYTSVPQEKEKLFKIRNLQQVSHSVEISEFNIQHIIQKFDKMTEYHIQSDEPKQQQKQENLEKIQEEDEDQQVETQQEVTKDNKLIEILMDPLKVFQNLQVKIIPIFEDLDKLYGKKKFQGLFDFGVIGFMQTAKLKDEQLKTLFKENSVLHVETAHFIIPLKKEEKQLANDNIIKVAGESGWQVCDQKPENITFKLK